MKWSDLQIRFLRFPLVQSREALWSSTSACEGREGLGKEIYRQLRESIVTGRLRPGDPLPPSRELARRLSVSRTTVVAAYDQLNGEGFVTSRAGAGTFVSDTVPTAGDATAQAASRLRPRPIWSAIPVPFIPIRVEFDLRTGLPDSTLFPHDAWRRMVARELRSSVSAGSYYDDPAGHLDLREAVAAHVGVSRAVAATADNIIVTNGTQESLDLVARVLLELGEQVAVEDPGYEPVRRLFESMGLSVAAVPVDRDGLVVDALPPTARLVFVTPSHQYPLGMTMSLPRRSEPSRSGPSRLESLFNRSRSGRCTQPTARQPPVSRSGTAPYQPRASAKVSVGCGAASSPPEL